MTIEREKTAEGEEPMVNIPFDAIGEAKLVLTDDLIREALKKDKEERRQRKKARRRGEQPVGESEDIADEE